MKTKLLTLAGLTSIALLSTSVGAQAPGTSDADFERTYAAMDTNKDGRISRAEYAAYHGTVFDTWDTTSSGTLTREQIRGKQFEREMRKTDGNPQGNTPLPGSVQKK